MSPSMDAVGLPANRSVMPVGASASHVPRPVVERRRTPDAVVVAVYEDPTSRAGNSRDRYRRREVGGNAADQVLDDARTGLAHVVNRAVEPFDEDVEPAGRGEQRGLTETTRRAHVLSADAGAVPRPMIRRVVDPERHDVEMARGRCSRPRDR